MVIEMANNGFDSEKYVLMQTQKISDRVNLFGDKLYVEFGGKLFDDYHASRVLPGFSPDTKVGVLDNLRDKLEVIFCVSAVDIDSGRIRGDSGLTYDLEALRCIDELRNAGLNVSNVVITLFNGQQKAHSLAEYLKSCGENVTLHGFTKGYDSKDIDLLVSDEGFGANPYVKTNSPIVLINAPGAKSGKLGFTLTQLYHEYRLGTKAGYAKFETFPCFDLEIGHPVNLAYEAATADLNDRIMVDTFHLKRYGKVATSYNRDMEAFPVLKNLLSRITHSSYESPTDMGFSSVGACITDDAIIRTAAENEIRRRYNRYSSEYQKGLISNGIVERVVGIANRANIRIDEQRTTFSGDFTSPTTKASVLALSKRYGDYIHDYSRRS